MFSHIIDCVGSKAIDTCSLIFYKVLWSFVIVIGKSENVFCYINVRENRMGNPEQLVHNTQYEDKQNKTTRHNKC